MTESEELRAWRTLALARGRILAAYRAQTLIPGEAIDEANAARKLLSEAGKFQQ